MASTQQIKSRISSVKNTKQITKAMELVSASKMRRAQEAAQRTRAYSLAARQLLTRLRELTDINQLPLYRTRPVKSRLLIVIASDRSLAGAYNSNVLRHYVNELKADQGAGVRNYTICIGRKAAAFVARLAYAEVIGAYQGFPDRPTPNDIQPIIATAIELFEQEKVDAVDIIYTHFHSSISQEAVRAHLLPAGFEAAEATSAVKLAEFEPSEEAVLEAATRRLLQAQVIQPVLEAYASEHSMRMLAMKNATDNATELVNDLTLAFNNARQAAITQELAEISGGAEALNE